MIGCPGERSPPSGLPCNLTLGLGLGFRLGFGLGFGYKLEMFRCRDKVWGMLRLGYRVRIRFRGSGGLGLGFGLRIYQVYM